MNGERPFRICWAQPSAAAIFKTEALEGDDAIFLATHSPISGFEVAGTQAAEFAAPDEQSVLNALSEPDRKHAFCVVQGEPGSGKSHLIRWLSVNWPEDRDVKLLLRRADGSLEGALRQLRERLPSEFHELFEGLGVRQKAKQQGRANIFLSNLADMAHPDHFEDRIGDEDWCGRCRPGEILGHPHVKERWKGPSRILQLLEGGSGERNSASASFNLFDIAELGELLVPVRSSLPSVGAKDLAQRLKRESELIGEHRAANWLAPELLADRGHELTFSAKLADVLNRRRNDAIQNVLGVSAAGLKTLFRKVRQELQRRGQRLVLLLEDITSWEGLDDSLIDVLVFNAAASGGEDDVDVCPLISVVGLTPAYYDQLQGNYRQRITHEIKLGQSTGSLQDVASLRDPAERFNFVRRYLAAVRAGVPALRSWREEMRHAPALSPPNACDACPKQPSCHSVFGAHEGVGLFPFTERALERFFDALKVDDNGQTWRTPRGILQAVLNPCLSQPDLVDRGEFPGPYVESRAIENAKLPANAISGRLGAIAAARVPEPQRVRFRRAITFWGDPESADTRLEGGVPVFAGMARPLYAALELPWLGAEEEDTAVAAQRRASPATSAHPSPHSTTSGTGSEQTASPRRPETEGEADQQSPLTSDTQSAIGNALRQKEEGSTKVARPPRNRRTQSQREVLREKLRAWASGGAPQSASQFEALLHDMISALDPRQMGVAPYLLQRLVTREMVKLQGSTTAMRDYLVVPPEDWVRAGLEGVIELELRKDMTTGDRAFHLRNIASMMRQLEALVLAYLRRRVPTTASGAIWSPVGAMAQVLQARAWLRGALAPDAPLTEQIRAILSDEEEAQSDPAARSAPWIEWLNSTKSWHERIRDELRKLISLAVDGGAGGAELVDSSELVGAVSRMRETMAMDEVPSDSMALSDGIARARKLAEEWKLAGPRILQTEFEQIKNRAQALEELLRHRSIEQHVKRLNDAIERTSQLLPSASTSLVETWIKERQQRLGRVLEQAGAVENLIFALDDKASILFAGPERLKWLLNAPARSLEDALALARTGERAVEALHPHARDCVWESQRGASLEAVKAVGHALQRASAAGKGTQKVAA